MVLVFSASSFKTGLQGGIIMIPFAPGIPNDPITLHCKNLGNHQLSSTRCSLDSSLVCTKWTSVRVPFSLLTPSFWRMRRHGHNRRAMYALDSRGASSGCMNVESRSVRSACIAAVEVGGVQAAEEQITKVTQGSRVRVKGPLKVYHVPKLPELELGGLEGEVKDVLGKWKGKQISANLPYKVKFSVQIGERLVNFVAHLKENEFDAAD